MISVLNRSRHFIQFIFNAFWHAFTVNVCSQSSWLDVLAKQASRIQNILWHTRQVTYSTVTKITSVQYREGVHECNCHTVAVTPVKGDKGHKNTIRWWWWEGFPSHDAESYSCYQKTAVSALTLVFPQKSLYSFNSCWFRKISASQETNDPNRTISYWVHIQEATQKQTKMTTGRQIWKVA